MQNNVQAHTTHEQQSMQPAPANTPTTTLTNTTPENLKSGYIWNTLGSLVAALGTVVLLSATTRLLGAYWAGIFSIAFAVGQQFQTVGTFEMRAIQSTDIKEEYSFVTYFAARILTSICMLICIFGYALVTRGFGQEMFLIILVASLRILDAFEDVFHGAFQQHGRLDVAGKTSFVRSLITVGSFIAVLAATQNLAIACIVSIVLSAAFIAFFALRYIPPIVHPKGTLVVKEIFRLMWLVAPVFIGSFLATYLANAPKYGLDAAMSEEYQAYYAALFMPALAINLLSTLVFRPLLTPLAQTWNAKKPQQFLHTLNLGYAGIAIAWLVGSILAWFIGIPVLNAFFSLNLDAYRGELVILILGGAFNALSVLLYYGLIIMRKQVAVLAGYGIAAALTFVLTAPLLTYELMGASILYVVAMGTTCVVFGICFALSYRKETKTL